MTDVFQRRTRELQGRLAEAGIDLLLLSDPDSIYYVTAYWADLEVEFDRPNAGTLVRILSGAAWPKHVWTGLRNDF